MKISRKEYFGLIIGAAVGAAPFLWVWLAFGQSGSRFDATMMWGIPAIVLAPFGALAGAIVGVAATSPK